MTFIEAVPLVMLTNRAKLLHGEIVCWWRCLEGWAPFSNVMFHTHSPMCSLQLELSTPIIAYGYWNKILLYHIEKI